MIDKQTPKTTEPTYKIYQLTVQGSLKEDWTDWFNGMLIAAEQHSEKNAKTTIKCRVRDQAELIGIINWLHNMNLIIVSVSLSSPVSETQDA